MNKLAILLLAIMASKGAVAGEVGAKDRVTAEPATLAYAVTKSGANETEWTIGPVNTPATNAQHKRMIRVTDQINHQISNKLAAQLELLFEAK